MYYVYEHCTYMIIHLQVALPHGIRGNTYGLISQTNLCKLQPFYLLNSYALHLQFITIYNMTIFNCYLSVLLCVSVPLCYCFYFTLVLSLLSLVLSPLTYACFFLSSSCPLTNTVLTYTYIWSMNADIIHQVILSYQVGVTLGKDHIRWSDTWSQLLICLDITRIWGSNQTI